jgi:hypothetical protein
MLHVLRYARSPEVLAMLIISIAAHRLSCLAVCGEVSECFVVKGEKHVHETCNTLAAIKKRP